MIDEVEDVSDSLARAFAEVSRCRIQDHPRLIYPVLSLLLEQIGDFPMALNVAGAADLLGERIGLNGRQAIVESARHVSTVFRQLVDPTYTAVSYWSPWDRRRHTIAHRRQPRSDSERRQCLTHACAFYDLTLNGPPHFYSVIHYVSERAARKRPLNVCYCRELPNQDNAHFWHIPPSLAEGILDATLIRTSIHDKIDQQGERSEEALIQALQQLLENREGQLVLPWNFSESIIKTFTALLREMAAPLRNEVERHQHILNTKLGDRNGSGQQVSFSQAAFMLMTHALYREACPADYLYMFPVRVPGTCCVMTIGTERPIAEKAQLALSAFVRTLFHQPLLLEYAAIEANAQLEVSESKATLERALTEGHSFGGPLSNAETALDSLRRRLPVDVLKSVESQLGDLSGALDRMKEIKYGMKKLAPYSLRERQPCRIDDILQTIAGEARSMGFECSLTIARSFMVDGDRLALVDCFRELLKNADRWVDRVGFRKLDIAASVVSRAALPRDLDVTLNYIRILFCDNGPGIPFDQREEVFKPYVTRHSKGLGLGLAMTRRKIDAHGGTITVIDPVKAGAAFEIVLPLCENRELEA